MSSIVGGRSTAAGSPFAGYARTVASRPPLGRRGRPRSPGYALDRCVRHGGRLQRRDHEQCHRRGEQRVVIHATERELRCQRLFSRHSCHRRGAGRSRGRGRRAQTTRSASKPQTKPLARLRRWLVPSRPLLRHSGRCHPCAYRGHQPLDRPRASGRSGVRH